MAEDKVATPPNAAAGPDGRGAGQAPSSLAALIILAAIPAAGYLCLALSGASSDWIEKLYRGIGLLTHDSDWAFGKSAEPNSLTFRLLAVIAPLVTAAAATYLLTDRLRLWLTRMVALLRIRIFRHTGVALVGLTEQSVALAVSLRRAGGQRRDRVIPLLFTDETGGRLAERCRRHGIATYPRHASNIGLDISGWRARAEGAEARKPHRAMNRANDLISFLPNAAAQVDFLAELRDWKPGDKTGRAWILLEDRGLTQRLDSQVARFAGWPFMPRLLAISTLAARQLLLSRQFDTLADAFGQGCIHLAIYGMGELGRAIVKEAAQLYVTRPSLHGAKLRVTFFDADAQATECALLAENPGLRTVIDMTGHTMRIDAAGLREAQLEELPADVTGHIITFEDGEAGFSLAVSMRRWLLEPPPEFDAPWCQAHHAAPIFVRASSWHGLGRLFYQPALPAKKGEARPPAFSPLPDGIFGFGAVEGLFGAPGVGVQKHGCLMDTASEDGAKSLHEAYRRARADIGVAAADGTARAAETAWRALSPQLRESNYRAYDHIAIKARAIGRRLVPREADQPEAAFADAGAIQTLTKLEHLRYLAERTADGWRFGARRLDAVGIHPDLVDWNDLDRREQKLDTAQIKALRDIAAGAHQRFAEALVIGVIGHRPNRLPADTTPIAKALQAQLRRLTAENSERAPLLLTALAPGADTLAAQAAEALRIPFVAPLPLPYELHREDFTAAGALDEFHRLAALAEMHVELKLRFGRASELTAGRQAAPGASDDLRAHQYALSGAYIVERAHVLIAVSDGGASQGIGGTADVLGWWDTGVPAHYATPDRFFVRPRDRGAAIVIGIDGSTAAHLQGGGKRP